MKVYVVSDVHLEYQWFEPPEPVDKECTLVIAGDLGHPILPSYRKYLIMAASRFKHVILITGNHEYYSKARTMAETEALISQVCQEVGDNVHFLNSSSITIDGIKFLGCTLWTDLTTVFHEKPCTNDFRMTKDLNISKYQELHLAQRYFLTTELKDKSTKTVVITHHPPSFQCAHKKYENLGKINCYFYNDLNVLIPESLCWIAGHTHDSTVTYLKGTPIVINPVGYPGEANDFNPFLYIDIDDTNLTIHKFSGVIKTLQ